MGRRRFFGAVAGLTALAGSSRANVALAAAETQMTPAAMSIPIVVNSALKTQSLIGDPWSCSVSKAIAAQVGLGAQIRVRRNANEYAIYTITEVRANDPANCVRLSYAGRQRLGTTATFNGSLRPALCTAKISDSKAMSDGEFIECLADSGNHQGLIAIAPHGGGVELNTDKQALRVVNALPNADVSAWVCKGWRPSGGAWERWHVTSTAIHPASFPGLASIAKRNFAYSVAFHGMGGNGVLIGGGGSSSIKQALRQAIKAKLGNISVTVANKGNPLGGTSSNNVTNWITAGNAGGVQIEQSYLVRDKYWREVADAVTQVFSELI
jgi:phage replication-related protein YjqB (UPF0714/DUF867 family)